MQTMSGARTCQIIRHQSTSVFSSGPCAAIISALSSRPGGGGASASGSAEAEAKAAAAGARAERATCSGVEVDAEGGLR